MRKCRDCRRPRATDADWAAFDEFKGECPSGCSWGADRCWYDLPCGFGAKEVTAIAREGRALRAGRQLRNVPHPHPLRAEQEEASA